MKKTMHKLFFSFFSIFLALSIAVPAFADTVTLFDGSSFRGIILKQDDNTVVLKTSSGEMAFQKGRVQRISFDDNDEKDQPVRQKSKHRAYSHKSPLLACCVSCLIPGLGQFYNGDAPAGFLCMGSCCLASLISYAGIPIDPTTGISDSRSAATSPLYLVGSGLSLGVWLYSMFEAYSAANTLNQDADEEATLSKVLLAEGIK